MRREHSIRGVFSLFAASVLLYMSAENADMFIRTKNGVYLIPTTLLAAGAVWEAWKVGHRVEHLLGLK